MRVIIERDLGPDGDRFAKLLRDAAEDIAGLFAGVEVTVVDHAVPHALITDRPDLAYEREVAGEPKT